MIIRNRISVGWLTAQPERLKRFMSLSNDNSVAKDAIDWGRHCEERSDEAIHTSLGRDGLLRCARNDGGKLRTTAPRPPGPSGPDRSSARRARPPWRLH